MAHVGRGITAELHRHLHIFVSRQRVEFDDSQDLYPTRIADKLVALDSFRFGEHFDVTITNFMLTANKTQALPFVAKSRPR